MSVKAKPTPRAPAVKPISQTAFYSCGARMLDAESARPACGDAYARTFMDDAALRFFDAFKDETMANASNVARHRVIDDWLRAALAADPRLCVVIIGAGFDARAYRLRGGTWIEVDEPALLAYKNVRLPVAECPNPLTRLAVDFATDVLAAKLAAFATDRAVAIVVEGVFMYLSQDAIGAMLRTLRRLFPRHRLICDLMSRAMAEQFGGPMREKLTAMGVTWLAVDDPEQVFVAGGYRCVERVSVTRKIAELGLVEIPAEAFETTLRAAVEGVTVCVFAY
jgi:methyltransferase (TIGR00027 family)